MSRVYIPQLPMRMVNGVLEPLYDISAASEYGEVVELVGPSAKPWTESVLDDMYERLAAVTEEDYILMIGSPVMCAITAAYVAQELNGRVKFLQWDGHRRRYFPINVSLWEQ